MDEWTVTATENGYVLSTNLHEFVCLVGKAGLIAANGKREGDMATPVGNWPLRRVYFRPDRMSPPQTLLPLVPIHENLGWCDTRHTAGCVAVTRDDMLASLAEASPATTLRIKG